MLERHKVEIQEISIVIAARRHNPSILNPDFLIRKRIVPATWELARPPICVEAFSQIVYEDRITITVDFEKLIFSELLEGRDPGELRIAKMAGLYVAALPEVEYLGVGVNPKGHVIFRDDPDAARKYLAAKVLSEGPWSHYGNEPVRVAIRLLYSLERRQAVLSVEEAQAPGELSVSALQFNANFHHDISAVARNIRLRELKSILANWQEDIEEYTKLVEEAFMGLESSQ